MNHAVTHSNRNNIHQFEITGHKTDHFIQHTREALSYIAAQCNQMEIDQLIIHCKITGEISVWECYDLSTNLEKFGFKRNALIAFIVNDTKKQHLNNFRETVAVNRGWTTKFFTNEQDAYAWLTPRRP